MLQISNVLAEKKSMVPAIVHYDGSARLQTIERIDKTSTLYELINAFYSKTSVPMLCNTSLNDKGEPIINTPSDAIRFAIKKRINILYINGKRYQINIKSNKSSTIFGFTLNFFQIFIRIFCFLFFNINTKKPLSNSRIKNKFLQ